MRASCHQASGVGVPHATNSEGAGPIEMAALPLRTAQPPPRAMTRSLALPPGHIDLWIADLELPGAAERSTCLSLLSPDERERYERFRVTASQTQFLAARGLLRTTLSLYRPIAPQRWRFSTNRYGRPFVEPAAAAGDLFFSLSHTEGLLACAVSACPEVGVDAEALDRRLDYVDLARSIFTSVEAALIAGAAPEVTAATFFAIWTLKEAYIKARGIGLSLPLDGFRFDLDGADPVIHFTDTVLDHRSLWQFRILRPTLRHIVSIAFGSPPAVGAMTVAVRSTGVLNGVC